MNQPIIVQKKYIRYVLNRIIMPHETTGLGINAVLGPRGPPPVYNSTHDMP